MTVKISLFLKMELHQYFDEEMMIYYDLNLLYSKMSTSRLLLEIQRLT